MGQTQPQSYHLEELRIARNPGDPRHVAPEIPAGVRVLDIGCGAGQTLIAADPAGLAVGVDVDVEALRLGRTLSSRILFVAARAEALPFRAASFDEVVSRLSLPYSDIRRAVREIRRVGVLGARVWIALHSLRLVIRTSFQWHPKKLAYLGYVVLNGALFNSIGLVLPYFGGRYESFQTFGGIQRAMRSAGFEAISRKSGSHFVVTATVGCLSGNDAGIPHEGRLSHPPRES